MADALFAIRIHSHRSMGTSPFYQVYGVNPRTPFDTSNPVIDMEVGQEAISNWRAKELEKLHAEREAAKKSYEEEQKKIKARHDERAREGGFKQNDLILLKNEQRNKFDPFFKGPFRVLEVSPNKALLKVESTDNARFTELSPWVNIARAKLLTNIDGNV